MKDVRSIAVALAITLGRPPVAAPQTAFEAKPVHNWSRLAAVSADQTVQITLRDGRRIVGTIQRFGPEGVAVVQQKRLTKVKFKEIEQPRRYRKGESVDLKLRDGRVLSGRVQEISTKGEDLRIADTNVADQLKREDVVRVRRNDRTRPALIGAMAGAAALTGLLVASPKDSLGPGESAGSRWAGLVAGGVIAGGGLGAGIGALIGRRVTIYEAPVR